MGKINLVNPYVNRVAPTGTLDIVFTTNFTPVDNVTTPTVTLKTSDTEDFATSSTVTPSSYKFWNGASYTSVVGNTINNADISKQLMVVLAALGSEIKKFVKVIVTSGANVYESQALLVTAITEIKFNLGSPIVLPRRPFRVRVSDVLNVVTTGAAPTFTVEVCNDAQDASPTWENMTAEYLAQDYYTFTNNTVDSGKSWAISVRYTIKKNTATDVVEMTEFYVAYV